MEGNGDILVEVKGLSKKFSRNLKLSLWYGLKEVMNSVFGLKGKRSELRKEEFWAIKDINFELRRGECLGLIGQNGAGKSTLLKMLNGLIAPDEGSITMRGKVGALIELGAGFNPILSGRENIYLNGQILGFSKKEIDAKLSAILDFAEIGEFIDSPIQNYSSGMKVRLGFAIAAQMEPDVLIIDEVLAVGDLGFVLKCFNTIDNLLENTAVIFVSHSMPLVSRICTKIMMIEKGTALFTGEDVSKGIDHYYKKFESLNQKNVIYDRGGDAVFLGLYFGKELEHESYCIDRLQDLKMNIKVNVKKHIAHFFIFLTIYDKEQRPIGVCQTIQPFKKVNSNGSDDNFDFYSINLVIPKINLSKGMYSISFSVTEELNIKPILRLQAVKFFQVYSENDIWPPIEFEGHWS